MIELKPIEHFDFSAHPKSKLLMIYTGGTIGMDFNERGQLMPCAFDRILNKVPVVKDLQINLSVIAFQQPIDSSNIKISHWQTLASIIQIHYDRYDGFIILHGTDTMAFSASALSFMLEGCNKPIIFTGSQLPIAGARSDARENLVTAIEIASEKYQHIPLVTEVCIFFNHVLLRGNRAKKVESNQFDAFESENYPILAEAGISIDYNQTHIKPFKKEKLKVHLDLNSKVGILKLFPGMPESWVKSILIDAQLKGVVMESFGAGNVPHEDWFISLLKKAIANNVLVINVSQCNGGRVWHGKYETSGDLDRIGILSGKDMTTEAALTKMMYALGKYNQINDQVECMKSSIRGEMN